MAIKVLTDGAAMVAVKDLIQHPKNARQGDVDAIVESIKVNGFFGSLVVQKSTNHVLAGNHTLQAAKKLKLKTVPVTWVDVDDATALKILAADNRVSDLGDYDQERLLELLKEIEESVGLEGTGYDEDYLEQLLADVSPPMEGEDEETDTEEGEEGLPPGSLTTHAESQVVQIQLFYTVKTVEAFLSDVDVLKERWGIQNVTDIVTRAISTLAKGE